MTEALKIYPASESYLDEILDLFRTTVSTVNARDYNAVQIAAWVAAADDRNRWIEKVENQFTGVAMVGNKVVGFVSLDPKEAYVDLLYVHPGWMRKGVGSALLDHVEAQASYLSIETIHAEVSITAHRFFEKKGYQTNFEQEVMRGPVSFINFHMSKRLFQ